MLTSFTNCTKYPQTQRHAKRSLTPSPAHVHHSHHPALPRQTHHERIDLFEAALYFGLAPKTCLSHDQQTFILCHAAHHHVLLTLAHIKKNGLDLIHLIFDAASPLSLLCACLKPHLSTCPVTLFIPGKSERHAFTRHHLGHYLSRTELAKALPSAHIVHTPTLLSFPQTQTPNFALDTNRCLEQLIPEQLPFPPPHPAAIPPQLLKAATHDIFKLLAMSPSPKRCTRQKA